MAEVLQFLLVTAVMVGAVYFVIKQIKKDGDQDLLP